MINGRTLIAALGLALVGATPAVAQTPGVVVDPDSPTAKQYAIPLESARRQADPGSDGRLAPPGAAAAGTKQAPLFGAGVTPAAKAGGKSRSGASGSQRSGSAPAPEKRASGTSRSQVAAAVSNPGAPSGGIGSTLAIAGGAALVLLLGGVTGVVLRRRSLD